MDLTDKTRSKPVLTGLFRDRDSAERAYQSISDRGYTRDDVNVVMSDDTRKRHFGGTTDGRQTELGTKAAEGAGIGGAIGGSLGAIAAAIAAVGTTIALAGPRPGHRRPAGGGDRRRGCRRGDRRHRRRADRLGHPGRARQGVRPGHPRRRHPDGGAPAQRRGRDATSRTPGRPTAASTSTGRGSPGARRSFARPAPSAPDLRERVRPEPRARPAAPRGRRPAPFHSASTAGSALTGARAGALGAARAAGARRAARARRAATRGRRHRCRRRRGRRRRQQPGGDVVADAAARAVVEIGHVAAGVGARSRRAGSAIRAQVELGLAERRRQVVVAGDRQHAQRRSRAPAPPRGRARCRAGRGRRG